MQFERHFCMKWNLHYSVFYKPLKTTANVSQKTRKRSIYLEKIEIRILSEIEIV